MIVQTRLRLLDILAEAQHDALLVRLDTIEAGQQPHDHEQQKQQDISLAADAAATGHHVLDALLALAQDFLKVGRLSAAAT